MFDPRCRTKSNNRMNEYSFLPFSRILNGFGCGIRLLVPRMFIFTHIIPTRQAVNKTKQQQQRLPILFIYVLPTEIVSFFSSSFIVMCGCVVRRRIYSKITSTVAPRPPSKSLFYFLVLILMRCFDV